MNLSLDADQAAVVEVVRAFVQREVLPHAREWDEQERFPSEAVSRCGELGLLGIAIPEAYGGLGLGEVAIAAVLEELARGDGSLALIVESHGCLAAGHIVAQGTEEQKRRWLPGLAAGEVLGAWCLTEPGSGSDASALRTRAVRDGDSWILDGTKMFITQGSVAGIYVVLASVDRDKGKDGITAFVVERGTPGLSSGRHLRKMGMRASDTAEVILEGVRIPDQQRLGPVGMGYRGALRVLERGRVAISGLALGIARAALEDSIRYAKERVQFGQPIAGYQAIQWMLADMATEIEAARALTWRAAWLIEQGLPHGAEAYMAKLMSSRVAVKAADTAIQIHGGYGYLREFPVERYLRDAKLCEIGEGTSEVQRMLIARALLRN